MYPTLLTEITKASLQTFLAERIYSALFWPNFFPFKFSPTLTFETLIGAAGNRVAADIVAYDSSAPLKKRKVIDKLTGDIPAIRVKRKMDEKDLMTYHILRSMANSDQQRLLELVYGDVDYVVDGVLARLEWLTLQALSKAQISLSRTNNGEGMVTEKVIDFGMPSANKAVTSAATAYWTAAAYATSDPITSIETIKTAMAAIGSKPRYVLMNQSKWADFRISAAVKDFVIPFALYGGTKKQRAPSLAVANQALMEEGLPTIIVIDTRITLEDVDGTQTSVDPWLDSAGADRYVTFLPDLRCGDMFYGPNAEELSPPKQATQAKRGNILVTKYSTVDPTSEFTKGEINAFPSWPNVAQCMILDTESHTTFGA